MLNWPMFLILPILIFLGSCGKYQSKSISSSGVIVGAISWIDVNKSLRPQITSITKSVADIYIPVNKSRCTGFLISENILMTNYHCVPDSILAVGVSANFSHEVDSISKNEFLCEDFLYSNEELDFSLLECKGYPGKKFGFLTLDEKTPSFGLTVYLIHHNCNYFENPSCDYTKKLSPGRIIKLDDGLIFNTTDSLMGSSGAPLVSTDTGKVVGLHHAGKVIGNNQRGPYNLAIPSEKILEDLREKAPEILEKI